MNRLTVLQKTICIWLIFALLLTFTGAFYIENTPNEHPGIIRLHIIANSDSKEDQKLKLQVRNAIIKHMEGKTSLEETRQYLQGDLKEIEEISEDVIKAKGFTYPARAKLKVTFIPVKSYDDMTLPAGNYEALNVTLGEGQGQNWWCVIFPQLCITGKGKSEKIVLKSKIKELVMKQDKKRGKRR